MVSALSKAYIINAYIRGEKYQTRRDDVLYLISASEAKIKVKKFPPDNRHYVTSKIFSILMNPIINSGKKPILP